jgi:hypothetical protein
MPTHAWPASRARRNRPLGRAVAGAKAVGSLLPGDTVLPDAAAALEEGTLFIPIRNLVVFATVPLYDGKMRNWRKMLNAATSSRRR